MTRRGGCSASSKPANEPSLHAIPFAIPNAIRIYSNRHAERHTKSPPIGIPSVVPIGNQSVGKIGVASYTDRVHNPKPPSTARWRWTWTRVPKAFGRKRNGLFARHQDGIATSKDEHWRTTAPKENVRRGQARPAGGRYTSGCPNGNSRRSGPQPRRKV